MKKLVLSRGITFALLLFPLLSFIGCYSTFEVSDSSAEKAIAIDWVDPPCAEPGSAAGYIEGNGFGAKNVTVTVGGIQAHVLAATGKDASFVVPEGLPPGPIEVVVMNPGGRIATINWYVCEVECDPPDCDDDNECTADSCDPVVEQCVHTPVGDGAACDFDGLPGICVAGTCEGGLCSGIDCDDGNECTADVCHASDSSDAILESFEGLSEGPNIVAGQPPASRRVNWLYPGVTGPFTFASGVVLSTPIPNEIIDNNGNHQIGNRDFARVGSAYYGLGPNGEITTAADVPFGSAYMATNTQILEGGGFVNTTIGFSFTEDVFIVGAYVNSSTVAGADLPITLSAYDALDALIQTTTIASIDVALWGSNFLGLKSETPIRRVEFDGFAMVLDGLMFQTVAPEGTVPDYAWCAHTTLPDGTSCGVDGVCETGACRERSWGTPVLVSPGQPQLSHATETRVVADHNGNVVVVWSRIEGTLDTLWSNSYTSGVGWGTPELIESGENGITDLELAVDPGGNVTAIWRRYQNFTYELLTSRYTSGVGWGPLELMDQSLHVGRDPQLAVGPNGQVIAVWQKYNATIPETRDIWANRYTPGVGWGAPELVVSGTAYPDYPRLAVDPNGFVTVAWHQSPDGTVANRTIWVNHFTPGVSWGTAALIDTPDVADFPRLVADSNGYVTLAWRQQSPPLSDLWANRYTPGVGWGTAELIETNDTNVPGRPRLVVDADGVVTAIWAQENSLSGPTLRSVWANRYRPGLGWGVAEVIETDNAGDASSPSVAVDRNGAVTVVWTQNDANDRESNWANRHTPGVGWGTPMLIEADDAGDARPPLLAVDDSGIVTAVWMQRSNGGTGPLSVFSNRFE